jgi:hypothetical protein
MTTSPARRVGLPGHNVKETRLTEFPDCPKKGRDHRRLHEVSMQRINGSDQGHLAPFGVESRSIRQLVRAKDVAKKLGVSISWVIQHASGKRKPYLPAVKMGPGRSPLRFDPLDVERFIDECRRIAVQRAGFARR